MTSFKLTTTFVFTSPNERQFKRVLTRKVIAFVNQHIAENSDLKAQFSGDNQIDFDWTRKTVPLTKADKEKDLLVDPNRYSVKVTITVTAKK